MTPGISIPDAEWFTHDAMNTTFSMRFRGLDAALARGLARECGEMLDLLESHLSRFFEGGDVFRINRLQAGETLYLSESCHQCLLLALDAWQRTGGLFDITLGTRIAHRKAGDAGPETPLAGKLTIHPDVPAITCEIPGRELDLGGIGKGFALDQLRRMLDGWDAPDFLLTAGGSSLLAHGPTPWPVELAGERQPISFFLTNKALSASGTGIQGDHIVHPGGAEAMPTSPCRRVWVVAASAVVAEIWSTALMLVAPEEIPEALAGDPEIIAVYAERDDGRVEHFGNDVPQVSA